MDTKYRWYQLRITSEKCPGTYKYRGLTREELRKAGLKKSTRDGEDYILSVCVDHPNVTQLTSGHAEALLEAIYKASGLDKEGTIYKEALDWLQDPETYLDAAAITTINGLTYEILIHADPSVRARYLMLGKLLFPLIVGKTPEEFFLSSILPAETARVDDPVANVSTIPSGDGGQTVHWVKKASS